MTLTPCLETHGTRCSSMAVACCLAMPNMRGMEGPVMSASRMPTVLPARRSSVARMPVTSDFPTPPLPDTTPMRCLTRDSPLSSNCGMPSCCSAMYVLPIYSETGGLLWCRRLCAGRRPLEYPNDVGLAFSWEGTGRQTRRDGLRLSQYGHFPWGKLALGRAESHLAAALRPRISKLSSLLQSNADMQSRRETGKLVTRQFVNSSGRSTFPCAPELQQTR